jgi:hypothetical protein
MFYRMVRLSRTDLYEQVWAIPMRTLAPQYGISDVGLKKACKRHKIPTPSAGYWAKKAAGKAPSRPGLPEIKDGWLQHVSFNVRAYGHPCSKRDWFDAKLAALAAADQDFPPILVSASLDDPHPLLARTIAWHKKCGEYERRDAKQQYREPAQPKGVVSVWAESDELLVRAYRIMDALLKGFTARGFGLRGSPDDGYVHLLIDGQKLEFSLCSCTCRVPHEWTKEEAVRVQRWGDLYAPRQWDHVESDQLALEFNKPGSWQTRSWSEKRGYKLEDKLSAVPLALLRRIDFDRETEAKMQDEQRAREEEHRRRQEIEEEEKRRRERRRQLRRDAKRWDEARRMRAFINAAREQFVHSGTLTAEQASWIKWASRVADRLDPLRGLEDAFSSRQTAKP